MKYEDLKCEFCDGHGEREINRDGADIMVICSFCNETGIDQLELLRPLNKDSEKMESLTKEIEQLILHAEEDSLDYSVLEHARKLIFTMNHPEEAKKLTDLSAFKGAFDSLGIKTDL